MRLVPVALGLALSLAGCVSPAFNDGVYATDVTDVEVHSSQVRVDVEEVWHVAQDVFGIMSSEPLRVTEFPRTLYGKVDGAKVTVEVLAFDLNRTTVKVRAKRLGFSDGRVAERVLQTLLAKLGERNPSM